MPFITEILPSKGLNINTPPEYIFGGMSPEVKNIEVRKHCIAKRAGTANFQTAPIRGDTKDIMAIATLMRDSEQHVLRIGTTKAEAYRTGNVWDDITGMADLTGTTKEPISITIPFDQTGNPALIFSNFIDPIKKYQGVNVENLGGHPPRAKYVQAFGPYLFIAWINEGIKVYPNQIRWCDTGNIEEWVNGNAGGDTLTDEQNDEGITGMNLFGNYLCIHKEKSIYLGTLTTNELIIVFERKPNIIGTVCNNTIQNLPTGEQIYLSKNGLMVFNGISSSLIEAPIQDEIRQGLNSVAVHRCWSCIISEKDEYWVGVPIGSQDLPETVYKFNYITRTVYKDERPNISAAGKMLQVENVIIDSVTIPIVETLGRFDDNTLMALSKPVLFGDKAGNTTILNNAISSDNGVIIESIYETKDYCIEQGFIVRWQGVKIWAKGNSLNVQHSFDGGRTWYGGKKMQLVDEYPSFTFPQIYYFDGVSDRVRFRFSNNKLGETWELKQYQIEYVAREKIR